MRVFYKRRKVAGGRGEEIYKRRKVAGDAEKKSTSGEKSPAVAEKKSTSGEKSLETRRRNLQAEKSHWRRGEEIYDGRKAATDCGKKSTTVEKLPQTVE